MYRARLIGPQEKEAFNNFVAYAPKGHILQSYEWGEIKGRGEWQPIRLLVEDKEGVPRAAVSILKRRIPLLGKAIFYAPRGPVGDVEDWELMDFLFAEVKKLASRHRAVFLKIDPDIPAGHRSFGEYLKSRNFVAGDKGAGFEGVQPKFVFRLDLSPSLEDLFHRFHPKTRYNIRLAEKKGVEVRDDCTREDLPVFYEILKETTERDRFLVRPYPYFLDLWDYLTPPGYLKLFMAYYEGKAIAGTLAFLFGDKAWYIYGASSNSHRNVMPNYLLQWRMIQWAKENGCLFYDFRGVPGNLSEDNPLYGLYRFKKGFNGTYTEFIGEHDLVFLPCHYRLWTRLEPLYQKNVRRLINLKKRLKK
ncbi:MAG: peptidoglycan bridge formation glycyltransferase FemA/FemB family protein [Peptococcaceae bacterium]|jgi:lipid II:glycine glycyltransferase (peptidoglycan interpeptide bridge formation enzyme)|nr:peptidoglycan bridge formation glycyltransferase FemA/FemB family protein [Peptococcaceae bacterium]MDH7523741.1 peptidoglycan bridge formation glycyltransferase FemA/FemB family protein [Peptococcaceae bacterium]